MVLNTLTVASSVTPTVIETYFSHYLNRKPLRQKPTAHISYHEGLELIRRFLHHASFHTVEEIQAFTQQWVPVPHWIQTDTVEISAEKLSKAAELLCAQLGPEGIEQVGGKNWWQWRRDGNPLKAEWIEMRKDATARRKSSKPHGTRIMMYVHGGAYYFGSVDEHRYQMQRHARKLKARVLAPRYRLAPQFPFPCGLQDAIATYLYLLVEHDPSTIILGGDSAGGGMVLSMLVTLRDQGIPLPAGAILLSPWVDLTHSFPSLGGDGKFDYIPAHGFVHKPSLAWPPPNSDDLKALEKGAVDPKKGAASKPADGEDKREQKEAERQEKKDRTRGYSVNESSQNVSDPRAAAFDNHTPAVVTEPTPNAPLSISIDGKVVEIKDQIQMYAANHLINHPLVSPVLQPTLGGLPPLLVQVGGGELLRDEQLYLAHKAAAPLKYVPAPNPHMSAEWIQENLAKYRSTLVQLQLWDDLCHVAPTLSFTRPAKYMYRSIAQFGAWVLARAQQTSIDIMDDSSISVISTSTSDEHSSGDDGEHVKKPTEAQNVEIIASAGLDPRPDHVGRAGDPLPPFERHMIRQRIDRNGLIYPLPPASEIPALQLESSEIGRIKEGPVRKWMGAQEKWTKKFARQKLNVQKKRLQAMAKGFERFEGEQPPPTALAGRRAKGMDKPAKNKRSMGMSLWSLWGSKHDETTIEHEEKADMDGVPTIPEDGANGGGGTVANSTGKSAARNKSRSKSRPRRPKIGASVGSHRSNVTDQGQGNEGSDGQMVAVQNTPSHLSPSGSPNAFPAISPLPSNGPVVPGTDTVVPDSNTLSTRPTREGVAYPFKLRLAKDGEPVNASTLTLQSVQPLDEKKNPSASSPPAESSAFTDPEEQKVIPITAGAMQCTTEKENEAPERPQPERFVTAREI
ncbi:alpha/beta-hydrolase [Pseudovirgaria hyperparasitica]|uniref:Alpha/beta-hydrolase n=1 Tax=Pseudovirgaria hyperparasitica TaxID=470096 RepID=A0A6A6WFL6_9PEZI|nr:alpha/beta-hydrolase [Pseudovirgaria hyperparasitica]KAF2760387.1 alpha/beta-hydrolase [Pseudovirgaria hyperparasitica]